MKAAAPPFSAPLEESVNSPVSQIPDPAFLFRPLTRDQKGCDEGCVGAECQHSTCHHSFPSILLPCENCELGFCRDHLTQVETFKLCPNCYAAHQNNREREYERWQESLMEQ